MLVWVSRQTSLQYNDNISAKTLIPVAAVKDAIHTLFGQLWTKEAGSNQGLLRGVAHTAGVLAPHPEGGVRPLHVHHEAAVRQVGAPCKHLGNSGIQ